MKRLVLIVDDIAYVAEGVGNSLRPHYDVAIATSGYQALKLAKEREIYAAIIDVNLETGSTGIETAEAIKKVCPRARILFFSAFDYAKEIDKFASELDSVFLEKPVSTQDLLNALNEDIVYGDD